MLITKIVFKLLPYPKFDLLMLSPFLSSQDACKVVSEIFKAGVIPSGLEFMERDAINLVLNIDDEPKRNFSIKIYVVCYYLLSISNERISYVFD